MTASPGLGAIEGSLSGSVDDGGTPVPLDDGGCAGAHEKADKRGARRRRVARQALAGGVLETLVGDDESSRAIEALVAELQLEDVRFLARGQRGVVLSATHAGGNIVIKRRRADKAGDADEAAWLRNCNAFGVGPALLAARDGAFAMERIQGVAVGEFLESALDGADVRRVVRSALDQCFALDGAGIEKREMQRPLRHLIVSAERCVFLDFERCRFVAKPRNVTQFCQYLASAWVLQQLRRLGVHVDVKALREATKAYKTDPANPTFQDILQALGIEPPPAET
ncbi:hypothetical protein M885DRAFT_585665 [Pelagophyceae sp. CCMP2097]|nr:hypothetical protein M885DRAFT_585665 [Pelagophyceae sp. CCMP2097]